MNSANRTRIPKADMGEQLRNGGGGMGDMCLAVAKIKRRLGGRREGWWTTFINKEAG